MNVSERGAEHQRSHPGHIARLGVAAVLTVVLAASVIIFASDAQANDSATGLDAAAPSQAARTLTAPTGVSITLDGDMNGWASVPGLSVPLTAVPDSFREELTDVQDATVTLKIATDANNIYVLVAVPDGYDYDPENHHLSPAFGVEWAGAAGAGPGMGATAPDYDTSGGMVDIRHWELDCAPGHSPAVASRPATTPTATWMTSTPRSPTSAKTTPPTTR